jgi:hypothetical protein
VLCRVLALCSQAGTYLTMTMMRLTCCLLQVHWCTHHKMLWKHRGRSGPHIPIAGRLVGSGQTRARQGRHSHAYAGTQQPRCKEAVMCATRLLDSSNS